MKIEPGKGMILVQIVAEDFEVAGRDKNILIPRFENKQTMFYNRVKILDIGEPEKDASQESIDWLKVGDIAIASRNAFAMGVPGQVKKTVEDGVQKWIDVMLFPRNQIIGKVEGDWGDDIDSKTLPVNFNSKVSKLTVN